MALVTQITKRLDIPHEPGEWMEIKKLSWAQLENASNIASEASFTMLKKMGGDLLSAIRDMDIQQEKNAEAKYDKGAVLECGIVRWSYDAKVSKETIAQLDEETAAWAFDEILGMNKPRTPEETKNA